MNARKRLRPIRIFAALGLLGGLTIAAYAGLGFYLENPDNTMLGRTGWVILFQLGIGVSVAAGILWRRSVRLARTRDGARAISARQVVAADASTADRTAADPGGATR